MKYELKEQNILFQFQKEKLTEDIKSVFNLSLAKIQWEKGLAEIQHKNIANLNIHQVKQLGLPPVCPYRLRISSKGRPITPAFSVEWEFLDQSSHQFYQVQRTGVILKLDGKLWTLTNPHFGFLDNLTRLSPQIKVPVERLSLWKEIIQYIPPETVLENKELISFQFIKAEQFCLDQQKSIDGSFQVTPELIYSINGEEQKNNSQLPMGVSNDFKNNFLKINSVDPYYKVGNYYIQISKPLRECLRIIKKVNQEPLAKRQAFYSNPMARIAKEISDNMSESLLEDIFFETEEFKSSRISHLGQWLPKLGIYIDPDNKNPWFPKEDIAIKIQDSLFHFDPDDLNTVIKDLENAQKAGKEHIVYKDQMILANDLSIFELKSVQKKIHTEAKKIQTSHALFKDTKTLKTSKLVAIIKDNIDILEYQALEQNRSYLEQNKNILKHFERKIEKYPHQEEGILWLQKNFIKGRPGVLLADDMGLGKTLQTLIFLYWYKKNINKNKPILIVAPTGLLKNWQDEHTQHLSQYEGLGKKYKAYGKSFRQDRRKSNLCVIQEMEKSNWVLTTYEAIRTHHTDYFTKISWGVVVFDEIQKIKNPNSLMTDASKAVASDFSVGLTGTPIENSFIDLWCISDCLYPKILGLLKDFHKKYIKNKTYHSAKEIQNKLFQKNPPFIMRRMKKDILNNLPKRTIITQKINMTEDQQNVYSEVVRKAKNKEYSSLQALSLLKRYSIYVQDCFDRSNKEWIQSSAKLTFLFDTLQNIENKQEKALICIESRNLQNTIKAICETKWKLTVRIINGDMLGEIRKSTVDLFANKDGFNIMIISPRAGGVGLNIVSANHIIHLDRWWNPAIEDQSNDRIFRIGQKKPVFVYYPLAIHPAYKDKSFDVILNNILENKRRMREETLMPAEPSKQEQKEFYRTVVPGEEWQGDIEGSFYESEEWKSLRKKVFQVYPPYCGRCGTKKHLEVDHIKPRSKYPELALDFDNLQILCSTCNLKKGVQDSPEWDFRKQ